MSSLLALIGLIGIALLIVILVAALFVGTDFYIIAITKVVEITTSIILATNDKWGLLVGILGLSFLLDMLYLRAEAQTRKKIMSIIET